MENLTLPYPKFIDHAVPFGGQCPLDLPEHLRQYCEQMAESRQG